MSKRMVDVEKLKKAVSQGREYLNIIISVKHLFNIIDSLAVEVPETKPNLEEIEKKYIDSRIELETEYKTGVTEIVDNYRSSSERYIAQLQAELTKATSEISRLVTLNDKLMTNERRLIDKSFQLKLYKDALRTLAIIIEKMRWKTNCAIPDNPTCQVVCFTDAFAKKEDCINNSIFYALANPTPEEA